MCLTGVSTSQVVCNQMTHVSIYNTIGVFGHGIAIDGNCGNDPVETVVITGNIIDTVHMPANKRNASAPPLSLLISPLSVLCRVSPAEGSAQAARGSRSRTQSTGPSAPPTACGLWPWATESVRCCVPARGAHD